MAESGLTPFDDAPQHGPRPLPLFLQLLRSETEGAPDRRAAALAGLRAYQRAERPRPMPAAPAIAAAGRAVLRDYGGEGVPIVFVPSLINPPFILDLAERNSLLRWLAEQGVRPMLVDWGAPSPAERDCDIAAHIEHLLLPLLRSIETPPLLAGYCLGGTMALAAAMLHPVAGLALIAAPWRFGGFPPAARDEIAALWQGARPACEALGLVPMEVLQSGFWRLDPARTVAKFERFGALDPASDRARAFVALEDWANAGAPLPFAAGRELFDRFFLRDDPGSGCWTVAGERIDPGRLDIPVTQFVSAHDRIVPAASAAPVGAVRTLASGHVGMVVGGRARAELWEPLARWLSDTARTR